MRGGRTPGPVPALRYRSCPGHAGPCGHGGRVSAHSVADRPQIPQGIMQPWPRAHHAAREAPAGMRRRRTRRPGRTVCRNSGGFLSLLPSRSIRAGRRGCWSSNRAYHRPRRFSLPGGSRRPPTHPEIRRENTHSRSGWRCTRAISLASSAPGLFSTLSGTPILPTSWSWHATSSRPVSTTPPKCPANTNAYAVRTNVQPVTACLRVLRGAAPLKRGLVRSHQRSSARSPRLADARRARVRVAEIIEELRRDFLEYASADWPSERVSDRARLRYRLWRDFNI